MVQRWSAGEAEVRVHDDATALAAAAAEQAAAAIVEAVDGRGTAHVMLATGNSQLGLLADLTARSDLPWSAVTAFHMDEYVGIAADHSASFRRYLRERVATRVPLHAFHFIEGDAADPAGECARYSDLLAAHPLDLCVLGIGENGHLAFNDPPVADFDDPKSVKVVELDSACRQQQVGEGHFASIGDVPTHAITVTIPALLSAGHVLAIVPERRKAAPVQAALEGPITTACPASVLRRHPHATIHLDPHSASQLTGRRR